MVINGDVTQIDPPLQEGEGRYQSGLLHAEKILEGRSNNILFQYFEEEDIVRHPLVQEICRLYDEEKEEE